MYTHTHTHTHADFPPFFFVADMSGRDSEAIAVVSQLPGTGDHILPFSFPKYADTSKTSTLVSCLMWQSILLECARGFVDNQLPSTRRG